jgi:tetratricopeptide (TPR) repeat protein
MARATALTAGPNGWPPGAAPPLRRLWQVPAFCLGLLAWLGVWLAQHQRQDGRGDSVAHDLRAARKALAPPRQDPERALGLLQDILTRAAGSRAQQAEAHFLAGSSYLLLAGTAPDAAEQRWRQARVQLEEAQRLGIDPADNLRLTYRLAKAWYHTGEDPRHIIAALLQTVENGADNVAEAYAMLAQCYLRLPQPDLAAALEANRKQLALPSVEEDVLAPARLLNGELLLRLEQRDEARVALSCIKPDAPRAIYVQARYLLAQTYQDEGQWLQAERLWREVLQSPDDVPVDRGRAQYYLGLCLARQSTRTLETVSAWEKAVQYPGEGSRAAAFRLAELHLANNQPTRAWKAFERAFQDWPPKGYESTLLPVAEARGICEAACQAFCKADEFESARRLALLYEKLALPGRVPLLLAHVADGWAEHLFNQSRSPNPEESARRLAQARAQQVEAGMAYEALAACAPTVADRADALWQSADRYIKAAEDERGLNVLDRLTALEVPDTRRAEAYLLMGGVHQAHQEEPQARDAYRKCVEYDKEGTFAYRARYQLAEIEMARGKLEEAERILEQNLNLMMAAPDAEAQEKTYGALANLEFRRGNYRLAAIRLRAALERYPTSPRALAERQLLADCYRRLAVEETQAAGHTSRWLDPHAESQYRQWLKMAAANYQKLKDDLLARQTAEGLAPADEEVLRRAEFDEAECRFELGTDNFGDAIRLYEVLAARYHHRAECLDALAQVTQCYWMRGQADKALETLNRIRAALKDMDDAAISRSKVRDSRHGWEDWLAKATQLLRSFLDRDRPHQ